ncbi:conjugative transposon protein TraM [Ferruginibacter sp.]
MKQLSLKKQRQRKMLLVLPALVLPFITMAFWALGGGKGGVTETPKTSSGLNLELPSAALKDDRSMDKMAYYDKAQSDSEKIIQQMKEDPYFIKPPAATDSILAPFADKSFGEADIKNASQDYRKGYTGSSYNDPNEAKVYQKLAQLNMVLKTNSSSNGNETAKDNPYATSESSNSDVEKLEQMLRAANDTKTEDPEMKQLNGMLEKILDIQHPERLTEKLKNNPAEDMQPPSKISGPIFSSTFSLIDTSSKTDGNNSSGFFSWNDGSTAQAQNSIEAVVHETQTLVTGAVIKLRLCSPICINDHCIPKDNFVFGIATLNNERLEININSIRDGNSLFPVKMEVYDMDGLAGIYIPGAITRDVAKQSGDNALQSVTLGSLNPSIGAQAASAGIETAKTLLSRKAKLVKVQVKAGYKILLKTKQQ